MSAYDNMVAVIDSVNKQRRVSWEDTGNHKFNINLTDMDYPLGKGSLLFFRENHARFSK